MSVTNRLASSSASDGGSSGKCIARLLAGTAIFTGLFASTAVMAQNVPATTPPTQSQPSASNENVTEDIIVTAQFRSQRLQDTPIAITAMTGEMLRQRGDLSVTDLAATAPSVTLSKGDGIYSGAQAFIRGVGQFDFQPAKEPGVGIYIDDIYSGNLVGSDFELLDLDRVEILRGPQGTLAGANSIGGSIKIYTAKPEGSGDGYIEAGYGSNQKVLVRGAFDIPLIENQLFLRVSGGINRDDGYVNIVDFACANPAQAGTLPRHNTENGNCVVGKAGGRNSTAVRGALRWTPSDRLEVNISADGNFIDLGPGASHLYALNQNLIDNPPNPPSYNAPLWLDLRTAPPSFRPGVPASYGVKLDSRFIPPAGSYTTYSTWADEEGLGRTLNPNGYLDTYGTAGTIDFKLSDQLSLKSITAYREAHSDTKEDQDGSPLNASSPANYVFDHRQITQELRLSGKAFDGFLDFTVGGFYYHANDHLAGLVDVQSVFIPFGGLVFVVDDHIVSSKAAAFATATIHPTDSLNITGGIRYTSSKKSYRYGRYDPDPPGLVTIFGLDALNSLPPTVAKTKRPDYRLAVDYRWTPGIMTYAQFATGFKDSGVNPTPTTVAQVLPFKEETLKAYEVGVKADLFDRHLRLNLAGFISKYQNLQLKSLTVDKDGFLLSLNSNAGRATIKGVEAEAEIFPIEGMLLTGSASYLNFKYDDLGTAGDPANGPSRPCITCTNIYTPKWQFSVAAQYEFDLGNLGSLTPRIDANYRGSMFADLSNNPAEKIASRWLTNARITWKEPSKKWEISISATNLFNKYYYNNVNDFYYGQGLAVASPARPREFLLSMRRQF